MLIEIDSQYQQFLNSIDHRTMSKVKYNKYSVFKASDSHVTQTNRKTKTIRDLYRVLFITPNKTTIDKNIGKDMIKKLFFQSVDGNTFEINKIENIVYHDKALYYKQYEKYKKKYSKGSSLERWLFHGTDSKILKQIEINGFDRNFNKKSHYGKVK